MSRVVALTFVRIMIALMVLECVLATLIPARATRTTLTHVAQKPFSSVLLNAFLAPEGEKVEEIGDKTFAVQIADLYQNIYFLSRIHATPGQLIFFRHFLDHPPSLHSLLCIFII